MQMTTGSTLTGRRGESTARGRAAGGACRSLQRRFTGILFSARRAAPLFAALVALFTAADSLAAWRPGLQSITLSSGSAIDKASFSASVTNAVLSPEMGETTTGWGNNTTYLYWGQIYLDGSTYNFAESIDDAVFLKINGSVILDNAAWNIVSVGSVALPEGWYDFELRLYNGTGGAGPANNDGWGTSSFGFGCNTSGYTGKASANYTFPVDPGDGTLFRYDDGTGFDDTLNVGAYPAKIGGELVSPPYGGHAGYAAGDGELCTAPASWTNGDATVIAVCTGWKLYDKAGDLVLSGSGNSFSYSHPDPAEMRELVWQWDVQYKITAEAAEGGSVTKSSEFVHYGSPFKVTAIPAEGFCFKRWVDVDSNVVGYSPELSVQVSGLARYTAQFGAMVNVAPNGSDETGDGSAAAPFLTLKKAFSVASADMTVILAPGEYPCSEELTLPDDIIVRGATGNPADVIIKAAASARLFRLNNAGSVIANMTVTGGRVSAYGGAVLIEAGGGTVQNCVFRNNAATGWGSNGGAVAIIGAGLVEDCVFSNNWATASGNGPDQIFGGGSAVYLEKGTLRNCLVVENGDMSLNGYASTRGGAIKIAGGLVEKCTVWGNFHPHCGGIVAGKADFTKHDALIVVRDCVIAGNRNLLDPTGHDTVYAGNSNHFINCIADMPISSSCIVNDRPLRNPAAGDFEPDGIAALNGAGYSATTRLSNLPDFAVATDKSVGLAPLTVTFSPEPMRMAGPVTFSWDWDGDGIFDESSEGPVSHTFEAGLHSVRVKAADSNGEYLRGTPLAVKSAAPVVRPVDGPALAAAVADGVDGQIIELDAGLYSISSMLQIDRGLTIRGTTGNPEDVVIRQTKSGIRVANINWPGTAIESLTVEKANSSLSNNPGGGIRIGSVGGSIVSNCVIRSCNVSSWGNFGGALAIIDPASLVTHCVITNNDNKAGGNGTAYPYAGGIVYVAAGTLRNTLLADNWTENSYAHRGGTVYIVGGRVENCTVVRNRNQFCSGIRATGGEVVNCIIAGNNAAQELDGHGSVWLESSAPFRNCVAPLEINDSCIVAMSPFVNEGARDWQPSPSAVDVAERLPWMEGATDLAGVARIQGSAPDAGCYEKDMSAFSAAVEAGALSGIAPLTVAFSVTAYGAGTSGITCYWDWNNDGMWDDSSEGEATHVFQAGVYQVVCMVVDNESGKEWTSAAPVTITCVPKTFYVSAGNEGAALPYATRETAAAAIADALSLAENGCEIIVLPGDYPVKSEICIDKDVSVVGETGNPEDVVIRRDAKNMRLVRIDSNGAFLAGVVLEGGNIENNTANYTKNGGGIYFGTRGGTVSNCVVRSCRTWVWGNEGDGVFIEAGADSALLTHSVISNCVSDTSSASDSGNALTMYAGSVRNCLMTGNRVTRNTATLTHAYGTVKIAGGRLENCTIVGNSGFSCPGVYATGGEVVNCLIGMNTSLASENNPSVEVWSGTASLFTHCVADREIAGGMNCRKGEISGYFKDAAAGDFRLKAKSPAVNAGVRRGWMDNATDIIGKDRCVGKPDAGCYECQTGAETLLIFR